ncbi:MAG: Na+/H+ antiporter NhaC family protein [Brevinema sp.]
MQPKPNFMGLTPVILFVVLVIVSGIIGKDFGTMPILVAFMISAGYALTLNPLDRKIPIGEKIDLFCTGGGEKTIILLVIIFLLAGAFYSTTIAIGARDATVNLGLAFVPTRMLLPGLFAIACIISFAMGTSMGTVTAIAPIAIGLGEQIGVKAPLMMGIVIGGAMFGDNLSFISDTTIAAVRTQGVKQTDKFKANIFVVLPAVIINIIALMMVPVIVGDNALGGDYNILLAVPYFLVIIFAFLKFDVISVLGIGIASACAIGMFTGAFTVRTMLSTI